MRVAMLILEYAPITGGAQRQLAQVAPRLQARGVDVQVITRRAPGLPARELRDGVRVHRLPAPGPKALASAVFTAAAVARLAALRPDVVHAYSLFSPATTAAVFATLRRTPVVLKVLRGGLGGDVARLRAKPLARGRIAALQRRVNRWLTISDEIDAELASLGVPAERRLALPNGVDLERFRPPAAGEREDLRRSLGLGDAPTAVYCGRLVPDKRVGELLDAWRAVREALPEARLLVAGTGPEEAALRARPAPGVQLLGERDDVPELLRLADLFVLPSMAEGLSNALLEAMASGLPVVATRVGAAPELVDAGCGRLVEPGDPAALATAATELLVHPERTALGERARAIAAERYSLEAVADRLAALYRELAPRPADRAALRSGVAVGGGGA